MKKVFLSLAVVSMIALASCGGNKTNNENTEATDNTQIEMVANDENSTDANAEVETAADANAEVETNNAE